MISILRIADDGEIWYISVSALLSGSACLSNNPRNVQYRHAVAVAQSFRFIPTCLFMATWHIINSKRFQTVFAVYYLAVHDMSRC